MRKLPRNLVISPTGCRVDFRRSFASGLRSGKEHGLLSRTAAGNRAYTGTGSSKKQINLQHEACLDQITQGCNFREKPREFFRFFDQPMNNL